MQARRLHAGMSLERHPGGSEPSGLIIDGHGLNGSGRERWSPGWRSSRAGC